MPEPITPEPVQTAPAPAPTRGAVLRALFGSVRLAYLPVLVTYFCYGASGITGIVFLGSLGENQTLTASEKLLVIREMVGVVKGRIPVLSGVAESSTAEASKYVREVERLGVDGFMLMPAMLYKGDTREIITHLTAVGRATGLPIMLYNNPISYANDLTPEIFARLAGIKNFVALKESSGDVRRITDLRNEVGERYAIFTGVDDLVLDSCIIDVSNC